MILKAYRKRSVWITLIPVILVMIAIFMFSQQKAEQSSDTSGRIVKVVVEVVVPEFPSLPQPEQESILDIASHIVRKLAHFTEFAALGFFMLLHLHALNRFYPLHFYPFRAWLFATVWAGLDEFHQAFIPGRGPGVKDVCIDSAGAFTGVLVMGLLLLLIRKCTRKES